MSGCQGLLFDLVGLVLPLRDGPSITPSESSLQLPPTAMALCKDLAVGQGMAIVGCSLLFAEGRGLFPLSLPPSVLGRSTSALLRIAESEAASDVSTNNRMRDIPVAWSSGGRSSGGAVVSLAAIVSVYLTVLHAPNATASTVKVCATLHIRMVWFTCALLVAGALVCCCRSANLSVRRR